MSAPAHCTHRSFTGIERKGGYLLRCKHCGLTTTTLRPDLVSATRHRREDWATAEKVKGAGDAA